MAGSVLCIVGGKGGVGCTSVAIELGQALARRGKIAIVDGDFSGRRSIAILLNGIKELDQARDPDGNLSFATLRSGVTAVEMAPNIHAGFTLKPEKVESLVQQLAAENIDAVVDAPQPFAAAIRPFVVRCSRFFLLVEPTLLGMTDENVARIRCKCRGDAEALTSCQFLSENLLVECTRKTQQYKNAHEFLHSY